MTAADTPSTAAKYIYKATLRSQYGLTDKYIARLGPAHKTMPNPHYACAAPSSLYSTKRVEAYLDAH